VLDSKIDESGAKQMNGTYGFAYSGSIGIGIGVFRIDGNDLIGADVMGGTYRGTASKDPTTGEITVSFGMFVPAGVFLVQGHIAVGLRFQETGDIVYDTA
jgi:hypothetical protein